MTHTQTHAHLCPLLFPHQQFFANDALVFLSPNALQNICLKFKKKKLVIKFYFFKTCNLHSKTWASQVLRSE